jgi:uncharacterized lipoprotein YehR (DUF1307 family)
MNPHTQGAKADRCKSKMKTKIVSTNKKEKTFTILTESGNKYRSFPQDKETFNYYKFHATENDIKQFLKTDDYYSVKK